ncbi:MAG: ATP-binding protein [Eggerthellaceae bacterium]|nr:ATP-binding protein [Eggerthellaceae bacterium]
MSLYRSVSDKLAQWHDDPMRKALLVTGARQVGKTFAIREFICSTYETSLEINFVETPQAKAIFEGNLDAATIIANLTAFSGQPLQPGRSVIFLDEVQECPRARSAIKFLVDDGRFDYIESGSLLGVLTRDVPSLPVGYENVIRMYPLGLREFFTALGLQPSTFDLLAECFEEKREVPAAVHERVMRMTRLYLACGGMPAAVDRLVKTQDLALVLGTQRDIVELYRLDIAKYAPNKPHVKTIFDSMPSEIIGANKRFKLRDLAPTARMERYASDFMWLVDAGVALPCYNVRAPQLPLAFNEQHSLFKLYPCDVGLLGSMLEKSVQFDLVQGDAGVNNGALLETLAAQELVANGYDLRYFDKSKYGEVDFVVPGDGEALPIEVKSGADYRKHRSLDNVMAVGEWGIEHAYVFCPGNVQCAGAITYLPWYLLMFFSSKTDEPLLVSW